jgi:hypothetical protein
MTRFTLYGAGLMMLVVGALHLFNPQMMMLEPGIELSTVNHFHVIRAAYGGAYLGIAALFLAGAVGRMDSRAALSAVVLIFGGFACLWRCIWGSWALRCFSRCARWSRSGAWRAPQRDERKERAQNLV